MKSTHSTLSKITVTVGLAGLLVSSVAATEDKDCYIVTRCKGKVTWVRDKKEATISGRPIPMIVLDKLPFNACLILSPGSKVSFNAYGKGKKVSLSAPETATGPLKYVVRDLKPEDADKGLEVIVDDRNRTIPSAKRGLELQSKMGGASARACGLQEGEKLPERTLNALVDSPEAVVTFDVESNSAIKSDATYWRRENKLNAKWQRSTAKAVVSGTTVRFSPDIKLKPEESYAFVVSASEPQANAQPTLVITRCSEQAVKDLLATLPDQKDLENCGQRISALGYFGLYERAFEELKAAQTKSPQASDWKAIEDRLLKSRKAGRILKEEKV